MEHFANTAVREAYALLQAGDAKTARKIAASVVKGRRTDPGAWYVKAKAHAALGQRASSRKAFAQSLSLEERVHGDDPKDARAGFRQACLLACLGRKDDACGAINGAVRRDGGFRGRLCVEAMDEPELKSIQREDRFRSVRSSAGLAGWRPPVTRRVRDNFKRKSCYVLRLETKSGSARKADHFVLGSMAEVRRALQRDLEGKLGLYFLLAQREMIALSLVQAGKAARTIDLRPFIAVSIAGYARMTFTRTGKLVGHNFRKPAEVEGAEGSLTAKLMSVGGPKFRVTVAWNRISLPPLKPPIAKRGDRNLLLDPGDGDDEYHYGLNDME